MPAINLKLTGGSLFGTGSSTPDFNLEAKDLTIAFRLGDAGSLPLVATIVTAGSSFNASGTLAGDQTLNTGAVDYQGVSHSSLFFTGSLQFNAHSVAIPADSVTPLQLTTTFKFSGTLSAFQNNPFIGPPGPAVFEATLQGKGIAVVRCSASYPAGATKARDVSSIFFGFEA